MILTVSLASSRALATAFSSVAKNSPTVLISSTMPETASAVISTSDARPVRSPAFPARDWTWSFTWPTPWMPSWMFWLISPMVAVCSSVALAMVLERSFIRATTWAISSTEATASWVSSCMALIMDVISSVDWAVWWASSLTSPATTAKPFPASPALAASMVAFSARRLVCSAIWLMTFMMSPIFSDAWLSFAMTSLAPCAFSWAWVVTDAVSAMLWAMSCVAVESSSTAWATPLRFSVAWLAAAATSADTFSRSLASPSTLPPALESLPLAVISTLVWLSSTFRMFPTPATTLLKARARRPTSSLPLVRMVLWNLPSPTSLSPLVTSWTPCSILFAITR